MSAAAGQTRRPAVAIQTSSGEIEYDRMSRRANLVEGLVFYLAVLSIWWLFLGAASRVQGCTWLRPLGVALLLAAALYAFGVAPAAHGDGWHALGLARPMELRAIGRQRDQGARRSLLTTLVALPLFVFLLVWANWDYLLIRLGFSPNSTSAYHTMVTQPWRSVGMGMTTIVLTMLFSVFGVRWDNLRSAARSVFWVTVASAGAIELVAATLAAASGDWTAFTGFSWVGTTRKAFISHLALYVLWAPLQQWFVLGYFNTRIRKGVPKFGRGLLSSRFLASVLTGLAFGAMHMPAWSLVAVTFAGGCAYGWLFQDDRYRNLFVMGLGHGLVGTLLATTTSMRMVVGP